MFFWAKKKSRCVSRSWPATSYLFQKHGDLHCLGFQSNGAVHETAGSWPVGVGVLRSSVCCENILGTSQVLGATFMMNQLVVFDIQSLGCTPCLGQNGPGNPSERDVMSTCDDSPEVFSTWIDAKPMSQLCAEAKATRKTTARQVASC